VSIPGGAPTGQVFSGSDTDFIVSDGAGNTGPARFIFVSESGNVTAWSPAVPPPAPSTQAQTMATVDGAIFKGVALVNDPMAGGRLYVADFHNGRVLVFDNTFTQTVTAGDFTDPDIPAGFAPFNVANVGGTL